MMSHCQLVHQRLSYISSVILLFFCISSVLNFFLPPVGTKANTSTRLQECLLLPISQSLTERLWLFWLTSVFTDLAESSQTNVHDPLGSSQIMLGTVPSVPGTEKLYSPTDEMSV